MKKKEEAWNLNEYCAVLLGAIMSHDGGTGTAAAVILNGTI